MHPLLNILYNLMQFVELLLSNVTCIRAVPVVERCYKTVFPVAHVCAVIDAEIEIVGCYFIAMVHCLPGR